MTKGKKLIIDGVEYPSVTQASETLQVARHTIQRWLGKVTPDENGVYIINRPNTDTRVTIYGKTYASLSEASRMLHMGPKTIKKEIEAHRFLYD